MTHEYEIGQVVQFPARRGVWRGGGAGGWFIFTTPAQSESAAAAWLMAQGCPECWFPVEVRWRKMARGKRSKVKYYAPIVPRYVFAFLPDEPNWDVMFDRARGKIAGVVSAHGAPVRIGDAEIMAIREVPKRLANVRAADRHARTLRTGDRAAVTAGPLKGWTVDVADIDGAIARIVVPLLGQSRVDIPVDALEKIQPLAI